jgi:hypothetical protein
MKRTLLLAPALLLLLLVLAPAFGCAAHVTTTTSTTATPTAGDVSAVTSTSSSSTTSTTLGVEWTFTAELTGAEVVPAVDTLATGHATITIDSGGTRGYFKLTVSNITGVIASRIHEGKPGTNGRGLLILYPGPTLDGALTGVLAEGSFDASALIGSLTGKSLAYLAVLFQSGQAYVNVGTTANPLGEIRGQIH